MTFIDKYIINKQTHSKYAEFISSNEFVSIYHIQDLNNYEVKLTLTIYIYDARGVNGTHVHI